MMTIPPDALKACGFTSPAKRSNFHLSNDETALKAMVSAAGFTSMHTWHSFAVLPGATDPLAYTELMETGSPSYGSLAACCPEPEDKNRWNEEIRRRAKEVLDRH